MVFANHVSRFTVLDSRFNSPYPSSRRGSNFLLNRRAHQIAPLGPRAIVVAHVFVAKQILEHKPGVRAAFADAAVSDDFLIASDALAGIQLAKRVGGLERAVFG